MAKESPGVLIDFFTNFKNDASITDPELKQLITALRFIQFDRTLAITDATGNITGDMITKINEINDTQLEMLHASVTFDTVTDAIKNDVTNTARIAAEKAALLRRILLLILRRLLLRLLIILRLLRLLMILFLTEMEIINFIILNILLLLVVLVKNTSMSL